MFSFLQGKYLGVELLGHRVDACLTFLKNYQPVSKMLYSWLNSKANLTIIY